MYKACSRCGKVHDTKLKCKPTTKLIYKRADTDKLRNKYAWAKKSAEIREASNYLCAVCLDEGVATYDNLEVHHITKLKDEPSRLLDNSNLICLCQEHHKMADKGEIDKKYLENLARLRDNS